MYTCSISLHIPWWKNNMVKAVCRVLNATLVFNVGKKYTIFYSFNNDWFCLIVSNIRTTNATDVISFCLFEIQITDGGEALIYLQGGPRRMRSCREVGHLLHLIPRTVWILAKNDVIITGTRGQGHKTITWHGSLFHSEGGDENGVKNIHQKSRFKKGFSLFWYFNSGILNKEKNSIAYLPKTNN